MTNAIATVNGSAIVTVNHDGDVLVPIKPICEALGIAASPQFTKLQEDEILAPTVALVPTIAADGVEREMLCLPIKYVFGWLFSISPKNVAVNARAAIVRYRYECYEALYAHFNAAMARAAEINKEEIRLIEKIECCKHDEQEAKARRKTALAELEKLRRERLSPQPTLF